MTTFGNKKATETKPATLAQAATLASDAATREAYRQAAEWSGPRAELTEEIAATVRNVAAR
jgi:hypothetical protein